MFYDFRNLLDINVKPVVCAHREPSMYFNIPQHIGDHRLPDFQHNDKRSKQAHPHSYFDLVMQRALRVCAELLPLGDHLIASIEREVIAR
jgi:hypothetical protein